MSQKKVKRKPTDSPLHPEAAQMIHLVEITDSKYNAFNIKRMLESVQTNEFNEFLFACRHEHASKRTKLKAGIVNTFFRGNFSEMGGNGLI